MMAFLLILGVPALGVLLYVAEHSRRYALTPRGREIARGGVLACGIGLGLAGVVLIAYGTIWAIEDGGDSPILVAAFTIVAVLTATVLMLWTARCAVRVFRLPLLPSDLAGEIRAESASEELRLACAAITLVPLLLLVLGMLGLFAGIVIIIWGVVSRSKRMSRESQFLWTLALAVRQNLPLAEEVDAFAEPFRSQTKRAYRSLSNRLRDGRSLGEALEMTDGVLSRPIAGELRTAEDAGTLPRVLADIAARHTTSLSRVRSDSSFAIVLLYGWTLLTIEAAVVGFVMYFIIPKYKEIFEDFGVELPPLTVAAVAASDLFVGYSYLILSGLELPVVAALAVAFVYCIGWGNLNYPLLMRWFPRRDAPPLLRSLSHVVETGQSLADIVEDIAHRHLRADVRQRLLRIGRALKLGQPLWEPLSNEGFIRDKEADALAAAQRAGNLPWALRTLADSMESTSRHRVQLWLEIAKPVLVVTVSLVVGWFVLAMFLPLVSLISDIASV
jgi:type IV pilus assembly protein PilC